MMMFPLGCVVLNLGISGTFLWIALLCAEQGWQESRCLSLKADRCMDVSALPLGPFVSNRKSKFKSRALRATVGLRCRKRKSKSAAVKVKVHHLWRSVLLCSSFFGEMLEKEKAASWFTAWDDCFWNHKMYSYNSLRQKQQQYKLEEHYFWRGRKEHHEARDEKIDTEEFCGTFFLYI